MSQHPPDPVPPEESDDGPCNHSWHKGIRTPAMIRAAVDSSYAVCLYCSKRISFDEILEAFIEYQTMIKTGIAVITGELDAHRADLAAAASELVMSMPQPGTVTAQLMRVNRLLKLDFEKSASRAMVLTTMILEAIKCIDDKPQVAKSFLVAVIND